MTSRRRFVAVIRILYAAMILLGNVQTAFSMKCNRTPEGHGASKTPADGRFHVRISENADKYKPGQTYSVSIEGIDAGVRQSTNSVRHKFSGFFLIVERKTNDSNADQEANTNEYGVFQLMHGNSLTKITCANMVTHTTTTPKAEIQVLWTAPQAGSGCVAFKATVIEHRDSWYMDDGPLTKEFCEDEQTFDDALELSIDPCCACKEAKYELTFEGMWSRNTHPKDFPTNSWLTRFSDIIGATHTVNYSFWQHGQPASDGMQQVAEHGATRLLEAELKGQSDEIRTIIKARGLAHPNVTGKTFAVFRVDANHHLVSFVSMIDPSPDWFVGVSRLELCQADCTWVETKVLDLFPWDAGTDSGSMYISPDQPTSPRDNIRRIRPDHPNDPRSPFYDPSGSTMKPLARLYLLRQRLYEKNCTEGRDGDSDSNEGGGGGSYFGHGGGGGGGGNRGQSRNDACATTPWKRWSKCDSSCGKGSKYRQREFVNPDAAQMCSVELTERADCYAAQQNCEEGQSGENEEVADPMCQRSAWSEFSECTPPCGNGTRTKTRHYLHARGAKKRCEGGHNHPRMVWTEPCENPEPCVGDITSSEEREREREREQNAQSGGREKSGDPSGDGGGSDGDDGGDDTAPTNDDCPLSERWSKFGLCSHSCGGGVKSRMKRPLDMPRCRNATKIQTMKCNWTPCPIPDFCSELPMNCAHDPRENLTPTNRWFYNNEEQRCMVFTWDCGDHPNNFALHHECMATCNTGMVGQRQSELELTDEKTDDSTRRQIEQTSRRRYYG